MESTAFQPPVSYALLLDDYADSTRVLLASESTIPLYHQLYRLLKRFIEQGGFSPGDRFPSEESLAALFGVSRPTANRAVHELVARQWLERERGRGTFVRGKKLVGLALLSGFLSLTEQFPPNAPLDTQIIARSVLHDSSPETAELQLPQDTSLLYFRRLRRVSGQPVMVCDSYLPHERFSDFTSSAFVGGSLYQTLEQRYGLLIERSERSLVAQELVDQQVAELLEVPPFSPVLQLKGLTYVTGENGPIEYMNAYVRECVAFENTVYRKRNAEQMASDESARSEHE